MGRSYGRHGELQCLLGKMQPVVNEIANLGPDIVYSTFPVLRFLPLPTSRKIKDFIKMKSDMMEILDRLSVFTVFNFPDQLELGVCLNV